MMLRTKRGFAPIGLVTIFLLLLPFGYAYADDLTGQALFQTQYIYDIWGDAENKFAVGSGGAILHYHGNGWALMSSSTKYSLSGVWGSSAKDVFAVGSDGVIVRFNGSDWTSMASGTANNLSDVWGSSGNDVFAVGGGGVILHYNGSAWTGMSSGTTDYLASVWGASGNDVFAAGWNGTVLHYNGNAWTAMSSGTTDYLASVWGASGNDVFAAGWNGSILHYAGSSWTSMVSGTTNHLYGVWGISGTDVFAVGINGTVLHYNGNTWTTMRSDTIKQLHAVWGSSGNDVLVVGKRVALHYDGTAWTTIATGAEPTPRLVQQSPISVPQAQPHLSIGVGAFVIAPDGADFQIGYRPGRSHWQIGYRFIRWTDTFEDPFTGRGLTKSTEKKTGPFLCYLINIEEGGTFYLGVSLLQWSRTERSLVTGEIGSDSTTPLFIGGGYIGWLGSFAYYNIGLLIAPGARLSTRTSVSSQEDEGGFDLQAQVGIAF